MAYFNKKEDIFLILIKRKKASFLRKCYETGWEDISTFYYDSFIPKCLMNFSDFDSEDYYSDSSKIELDLSEKTDESINNMRLMLILSFISFLCCLISIILMLKFTEKTTKNLIHINLLTAFFLRSFMVVAAQLVLIFQNDLYSIAADEEMLKIYDVAKFQQSNLSQMIQNNKELCGRQMTRLTPSLATWPLCGHRSLKSIL